VGNFFGGIFWRNFFLPHTKFLQIVEYLRNGGIFRGNFPPKNSSEAENAGGIYPFSLSLLEEFSGILKHVLYIIQICVSIFKFLFI